MYEIIVEFYKGRLIGRQKYRFRVKDGGNFKTLASSNDAYVNLQDACNAAADVVGIEYRPEGTVYFKYLFEEKI